MANSPSPSSAAPPVTTETFQKHYGRGSNYPTDPTHHGHPPPPPHNYPPSQYASGQHVPSHYPPPGHRGGHPPTHGHGGYHHQSWYYPPHAQEASAQTAAGPSSEMVGPSSEMVVSSSSRRSASRAAKKSSSVSPNLVTPKSNDSETLPPIAAEKSKVESKKSTTKSSNKKANSAKSKSKKERSNKVSSSVSDKELEMEEEPKVEPMKQDFHFYAMDHYEEAKQASQQQLDNSFANGTIPEKNKDKELYLLTTLLNARLIQNWESAPHSTRAQYLKKEEADRKRFMSEEEVASRHCATLTARRRSPKQSGGVGRMGSFGLTSTVEVPSSSPVGIARQGGSTKRPGSEIDGEGSEGAAKRARAV